MPVARSLVWYQEVPMLVVCSRKAKGRMSTGKGEAVNKKAKILEDENLLVDCFSQYTPSVYLSWYVFVCLSWRASMFS